MSRQSRGQKTEPQRKTERRKWMYQVKRGWTLYDEQMQKELSEKASNDEFNFVVTIRGKQYEIDLVQWKQISKDNPASSRDINREYPSYLNNLVEPTPRKPRRKFNSYAQELPNTNADGFVNYNQFESSLDETGAQNTAQWLFQGRKGWWPYDDELQERLESCFCKNIHITDEFINGQWYRIDLDKLTQTNINDSSRVRKIKRFQQQDLQQVQHQQISIPQFFISILEALGLLLLFEAFFGKISRGNNTAN